MNKYISDINGFLPKINKDVTINANGKNVIVTGMNGCGKTAFLKSLFENIKNDIDLNKIREVRETQRNITIFENEIKRNTDKYELKNHQENLVYFQERLRKLISDSALTLAWNDYDNVLEMSENNKFILGFFSATRQYNVPEGTLINMSLSDIISYGASQNITDDFSITFESYLCAYLESGYLAYALRNDDEKKIKVDLFIKSITNDLKYLFEDESLELIYNENEKKFYISQSGKDNYLFKYLSSGYSSILQIYTDLLMKTELRGISTKELSGIVIIDEIDAHLHVTLQRKILTFLDETYPNVQFIVSTHSPFVLQSVDNSIIYDLSKLEQLEDLSFYSYEAIVKGLLGVDTKSDSLSDIISELSSLIHEAKYNKERIGELIKLLSSVGVNLDIKSKVILLMAQQAISDLEE